MHDKKLLLELLAKQAKEVEQLIIDRPGTMMSDAFQISTEFQTIHNAINRIRDTAAKEG